MPVLEQMGRYEAVVYWEFTGRGPDGEAVLKDPVQLLVRIDDSQKSMLDQNGDKIPIDVQLVLDQDLVVESEVAYGTLQQWMGTGSGDDPPVQVFTVIMNNSTNSVDKRFTRYEAGLQRGRRSRSKTEAEFDPEEV